MIEKKNDVIPSPSPMSGVVPEKKPGGVLGFAGKPVGGKFKDLPFKKKIPFIFAIFLVAVVILSVVIFLIQSALPEKPKPLPYIVPTEPITEPIATSSSTYATDSAILKIGRDLQELDEGLKQAKFREPALLPPNIDLNVRFDVTD